MNQPTPLSNKSSYNQTPSPPHHGAEMNRLTKFMHLLLKYPHNIDLILLLLKLGSLRFAEIAEWTKTCFNMPKTTTYRRLHELVQANMIRKTPNSHKDVHYSIVRSARKTILQLLKNLNLVQTVNQAGTIITQITTPYITYQLTLGH